VTTGADAPPTVCVEVGCAAEDTVTTDTEAAPPFEVAVSWVSDSDAVSTDTEAAPPFEVAVSWAPDSDAVATGSRAADDDFALGTGLWTACDDGAASKELDAWGD